MYLFILKSNIGKFLKIQWFSIFFLNLVFICKAAKVGHYKLTDSRGPDLFDSSNSCNHDLLSSSHYTSFIPFIETDRGYYIYSTSYIQFPSNKYKPYPGSSELILGIWQKALSEGYFFRFFCNHDSLFPLRNALHSFSIRVWCRDLYSNWTYLSPRLNPIGQSGLSLAKVDTTIHRRWWSNKDSGRIFKAWICVLPKLLMILRLRSKV